MSLLTWIGEDPDESLGEDLPVRRVKTERLSLEPDEAEELSPEESGPIESGFRKGRSKNVSFLRECGGAVKTGSEETEEVPSAFESDEEEDSSALWEQLTGEITLSDVRPTKRGRMALFVQKSGEEQFLFSVDEETAARMHLAAGCVLTALQLQQAHSQSDLRRAKDKALQYLSLRDHAGNELYRKLCRKFDEASSAAAVAEMQRLGLLDDAAFAVHRAAYLCRKGKSRREISMTLAQLGIDRELREEALETLPQPEEETLRALVEKSYRSKLAAGKVQNVTAALVRRGFSAREVRAVLEEYAAQQQTDED